MDNTKAKNEITKLILKKLSSAMLVNEDSIKYLGHLNLNVLMVKKAMGVGLKDVIIFIYEGVIVSEAMILDDLLTGKDTERINHKHSRVNIFKEHFKEDIDIFTVHVDIIKAIERYSRYYYHRKYTRRYVELVPIEYAYKLYPHWK